MTAIARSVIVPARAKLNLDLKVVGLRADGLHELRTTMQAIDLHDVLEVSPAGRTSLDVTGIEVASKGNSVLAAHAALEAAAGRNLHTRIALHKRIPPGSGLGGASSDAAATLRALKSLHCLEVDLQPLAAAVGADVTFLLSGGRGRVSGAGEHVTPVSTAEAWYAVAWPGIELSTAAVYQAWDEVHGEGPNELRKAAARADSRIDRFAELLGADWQMTGSGSAFFKTCPTREAAHAATRNLDCWTAVSHAVGPWT